jgi:diguanylate cyclase (GGDEF)-like protein/PAS domain S-box-containing protein
MHAEYQLSLVAISVGIAIFSCSVALFLINGIDKPSKTTKQFHIVSAAVIFASGTWAMHFIGMLAVKLPMPLAYDPLITIASFLFAVAGAVPAMFIFNNKPHTWVHRLEAAACLTLAICAMHYVGMAGMKAHPVTVYRSFWFGISIVAAFIASYGILWTTEYWQKTKDKHHGLFLGSGTLLGIAVSSVHYTAMAATHFDMAGVSQAAVSGLDRDKLAYLVGSLTVLIMLIVVFTSLQQSRIELWKTLLIVGLSELTIMLMMPVILPENASVLLESVLDVLFLMLFVSPVAWRLKQAADGLYRNQQEAEKNLHSQNAINQLLSLPLHQLDMEELLNRALNIVFSIAWLKVVPKGAIFLNNPNDKVLRMAAQHNLSPEIRQSCAEVEHGRCLCGAAAAMLEIQHHSHVDASHVVKYDTMKDHGHYIVPLISEQQLNGVLCLYLKAGHQFDAAEADILKVLGATLSELIRSKQTLIELGLANTVFKHSLTCLMVADAGNRILNINPAFTAVTGYSIDEIKGKQPSILTSGQHDAAFYADMWQQLNEKGTWQGEIWDKKKNGEIFLEWLSITVVRDHKGQVQNYIAAFADITHQKEAEKRIRQLAYYDNLTGLANRTLFYDRLEQAIIQAKRNRTKLALLFIDLDRFKEVNDTLGHDAGDELLKTVATRIRGCLRESDVLARLGGDEFVVLLRELDGTSHGHAVESCKKVADNILRRLGEGHHYQRYTFYGGGSIGIVIYPDNAEVVSDLIQRADTAMYEAKNAGRNTYRFFSSELAMALESKLSMNHALRHALENHELSLMYQPLVNMGDRSIIGAEVLLRWHNAELGEVSPARFIPLAEESGVIVSIGEWVIEQACRQLQLWQAQDKVKLQYLAVNVSIHQLIHPSFADRVLALCRQFDVPPQHLELEITEGGLAQYPDSIADILNQLRLAGFRLAIDDFGTDYSSLGRLKSFNVDLLKIDRSFVNDMTSDPDDAAIVKAIIDLADALGLTTLAEGVETVAQFELLKQYGCLRGQGYLFGKPMRVEIFEDLFDKKTNG